LRPFSRSVSNAILVIEFEVFSAKGHSTTPGGEAVLG
jgi:hypothetical protein